MRKRSYDYTALLAAPEPWVIPLGVIEDLDVLYFDELGEAERVLCLVDAYVREVNHGGHEYWFGTMYADYAEETAAALEAIGAPPYAAYLRRAFAVWPDGQVPEDIDEREDVITDKWLADDPDGAMKVLNAIDHEFYEHEGLDEAELGYEWIRSNPEAFGIAPEDVPTAEELKARIDAAQTKSRAELDAEPEKPEEPEVEIPETVTWRLPPRGLWITGGLGALCLLLSWWMLGRIAPLFGGLVFAAGLALIPTALLRTRWRLVMDPKGIHETRRPTIPWSHVTGCRMLSLVGLQGFEIEVTNPTGGSRVAWISRGLIGPVPPFHVFLTMVERHDAPWSPMSGLQSVRNSLGDS